MSDTGAVRLTVPRIDQKHVQDNCRNYRVTERVCILNTSLMQATFSYLVSVNSACLNL